MTTQTRKNNVLTTRTMTKIAILSALAAALMWLEFPIFFAPSFMGIDFSDVPVILAGYTISPIAGVLTGIFKIVIKLLIKPTSTAFIGELSNLFLTVVYVLTATIYYKRHRNFKGAIVSLILATFVISIAGFLSNAFVIYPLYAFALNMDINGIVTMTSKINGFVNNYWTMMFFMVIPFNLLKYSLVSIVTLMLYKHVSPILKS
ncbi:MAG: ECF transporter S component [Erysipelothrix sp.]|jgi:riboflavin transporter FmnP|nr:ECF transporter S component [Erysipelothrix sp.]